ncbi:hypothetical protein JOC54_002693 [Alkalihalobacillus xiaoxiensis]|uniref:Asparagine synthetase domain-containing protein n=1 Tax=Shouchella xiaoxiensis TaxID=766895 RepID=A0ABS2SV83_9BACI|nr:asparagine synthase-related protein [Shouchella xiaoxiensis]MBM7839413.1 hypothetical protein [Shouchella xiaoxiensis]
MDLNLNSFLKLGYYLDYKENRYNFDFSNVDQKRYNNFNEEELIKIGSGKLTDAISENFKENELNVVPISGGLDSRAILAALLEFTDSQNIETYTFGTPGTLDFEIGKQVGRKLGTKHTEFSLKDYKYVLTDLLDISKRINQQTILFHHPPIHYIDKLYGGGKLWMGSFAGPISGGSIRNKPFKNMIDAKKHFIKKNTYSKSVDLCNVNEEMFYDSIDYNEKNINNLEFEENLDFYNRQLKFIVPHVLMKGFNYGVPFINKEWVDFIMSVDSKYRYNQYLYKKILLYTFPKAFAIRTKNNHGLSIKAKPIQVLSKRITNKFFSNISQHTNYIDFNEAINKRDDLREIIYENVMDLKNRNIVNWVDIEGIWKAHNRKEAKNADALVILASLEIHIKSKELN